MDCPICLEPYTGSSGDRVPKAFPCGHSICGSCLGQFPGNEILCPECRSSTEKAKVTTNFAACAMIEATAKKAKTRLTRPAGRAPSGSRSKSSSTTVPEDDGFFSMDEESNDGSQVHSEKDMSPSAPPPEPWEDLTPSAPRMEVQAGYPDVSASSSGAPELDQERGSSPGNHAMIFELVERGKLKHRECINAFKAVDRAHFVPMVTSDSAYAESPLRCGQLHLSAPHIYAQALMALMPLRQGMSFLNIGSGSGYFSCVVSELTGRHARNHGIEIWPENTEHATSCAAAIGKHHLEFTTQNIYELDFTDTQRYDRIYIGACATSKFRFLYRLLEVGGVLIGPFQVGEGQELRRVLRQTETEFSVEMLGSESCEPSQSPRNCLVKSFRSLNWRLYTALLLKAAMPTVYTTTRMYFLGQMPQASGVDIASQLYWVSLLLEVMEEALIVPLYPCIGETISQDLATRNKVRTGLLVTLVFYSSFSSIVMIFAEPLVDSMAPQQALRADTVKYIRWEMVAAVIQGLERFSHVVFVLLKRHKVILATTLLQTFLTVLFDYLFVSDLPGSFRMGVIGLALSNICTYTLVLLLACFYLPGAGGRPLNWSWLLSWWRVGRWAALASLIRNLSYVIFVARMVNVLHQSGNYWIANNFIWKWLLLLFLPLAELLKQEVSCRARVQSAHLQILPAYFMLSLALFVVWLLTMPGWRIFFEVVLNVEKPLMALEIANWLVPFYFFYMFAALFDSIFYGFGFTDQLACVSIVANLGVYGSAFILYSLGVFSLSMKAVMDLFGSGIVVGTALRIILYYRYFLRTRRG